MNIDIPLRADVLAALAGAHPDHATKIGAIVSDGVVTLFGDVTDNVEKRRILHVVRNVPGVTALAVALRETHGLHASEGDAEIAGQVVLGLKRTEGTPAARIRVMVEAGKVTLSGEVDVDSQKQCALDSVRYLRGVVHVDDEILVKAMVSTKTGVAIDTA